MEKFCKSCGMPMDKPEDFSNHNPESDYCYYCGDLKKIKKEIPKREIILKKEEYLRKKIKKKIKKKSIRKK